MDYKEYFVSESLSKQIKKQGMAYCGSTDSAVFKKQYISECGDARWIKLLEYYMIKDKYLKKVFEFDKKGARSYLVPNPNKVECYHPAPRTSRW